MYLFIYKPPFSSSTQHYLSLSGVRAVVHRLSCEGSTVKGLNDFK